MRGAERAFGICLLASAARGGGAKAGEDHWLGGRDTGGPPKKPTLTTPWIVAMACVCAFGCAVLAAVLFYTRRLKARKAKAQAQGASPQKGGLLNAIEMQEIPFARLPPVPHPDYCPATSTQTKTRGSPSGSETAGTPPSARAQAMSRRGSRAFVATPASLPGADPLVDPFIDLVQTHKVHLRAPSPLPPSVLADSHLLASPADGLGSRRPSTDFQPISQKRSAEAHRRDGLTVSARLAAADAIASTRSRRSTPLPMSRPRRDTQVALVM